MRKLTVLLWLGLVLLFCDRIESRTTNVLKRRLKRAVFVWNDFADGDAGGRRKRYAETLRLGDTAVSTGRSLTRTRRGYLWTDLDVETPWAKHLAQRAKRG